MKSLWQDLKNSALSIKKEKINNLFVNDSNRVQTFSLQVGDLYLDYSKNFITPEIFSQLIALADASHLQDAIKRLSQGEHLNKTENRTVQHTALRAENPTAQIAEQKAKMYDLVEKLQQDKFTDIVNLGIGGSDLGPVMAIEALKPYQTSSLKIHFVSNVDPEAIDEVLKPLDPQTTLFIISSKSFSTPETLTNAQVAKEWLSAKVDESGIKRHFIAVTAKPEKALAWGIDPQCILTFWDWVGGRYSIWSSIGLPLALSIGIHHFEDFLKGAQSMDQHFATAPFHANMPVILALLGLWYINFWDASTLAVLPYAQSLRRLSDYLQQLDMESNGKSVDNTGINVSYATGPIVWGQAGTNGQHAFYQLLHQGTHFIPVDFIVARKSHSNRALQHQQLVANCLAQAQALMQGREGKALAPHETMPGNKPSNMLVLSQLTPSALGQLLALYEHKVFVQGIIWNINSFDQPGVELGKKLAEQVMKALQSKRKDPQMDASTCTLIDKI